MLYIYDSYIFFSRVTVLYEILLGCIFFLLSLAVLVPSVTRSVNLIHLRRFTERVMEEDTLQNNVIKNNKQTDLQHVKTTLHHKREKPPRTQRTKISN